MENLQANFSLVQGSNKKLNGMGDDGSPPVKKLLTDIHTNGKMVNKVPTVKNTWMSMEKHQRKLMESMSSRPVLLCLNL